MTKQQPAGPAVVVWRVGGEAFVGRRRAGILADSGYFSVLVRAGGGIGSVRRDGMGAVPGGFKGAGHADQQDRAHVSNPLMSGLAARDFLSGCAVHPKLCKRAVL